MEVVSYYKFLMALCLIICVLAKVNKKLSTNNRSWRQNTLGIIKFWGKKIMHHRLRVFAFKLSVCTSASLASSLCLLDIFVLHESFKHSNTYKQTPISLITSRPLWHFLLKSSLHTSVLFFNNGFSSLTVLLFYFAKKCVSKNIKWSYGQLTIWFPAQRNNHWIPYLPRIVTKKTHT